MSLLGPPPSGPAPPGPIQGLDPRTRLLGSGLFALVVIALSGLATLAAALALAALVAILARPPLVPTLRRMAAMDGFMLFILILLPFSMPGTPVLEWGTITASAEGITRAVAILLKANAILLMLLALVGSLDAVTLGHALARLGIPATLVQLFFFTVRYVTVIGDEYARLRTAMRARAFRPANTGHTYRSIGYLVGMLLIRSLERSERISAAMRCRGFQGRFHLLDGFRYRPADALFAGCLLSCVIVLIALDSLRGPSV